MTIHVEPLPAGKPSGFSGGVGQFAIRGGILDVYSPNYDDPIRVEFWGDELMDDLFEEMRERELFGN